MKLAAVVLLAIVTLSFSGDAGTLVREGQSYLQHHVLPGVVQGYVALGEAEMLVRLPR